MINKWSKKIIERLQEKNREHKNIRAVLFELSKTGGYILKPIRLIWLFYGWLQENHDSKMNAEKARNMAEVFSTLCHVYYIAGEKSRKVENDFYVSQNVWDKLCIKRTALESSIKYLQEMGLIRFYNRCENGCLERRKRRYIINRKMLEFRIRAANEAKQAKEDNDVPSDLLYGSWSVYKGKKIRICLESKTNCDGESYEDLDDLFNDGFYFC